MTPLRRGAAAIAIAVASLFAFSPAQAGPRDDTLNVAMARETDFVDRLHTNARESQLLSSLIYDTLIYAHPQTGKVDGLLAKSWTWVDGTTVEFELREGIKFHNGEPFDADDVVYTIGIVTDLSNNLRQQAADFGNLQSAEKVGPYKVRIKLKRPQPTIEYLFANRLIMWPNEYTAANGHAVHGTKPVGTGPYSLRSLSAGRGYVLARNDAYVGGPRPKAAIGTINFRVIPEIQTQVAELMVGNVEMSFDIPGDESEALKPMPSVKVGYGGTTRYTFLILDAAGRSGDTPLKNPKFRQAIAHSIDRNAIATQLAGGGATAIGTQCNPAQGMCAQDVAAPAYDPARARQLLQEAGLRPGVSVNFMSSSDLRRIGEAIQAQLAVVGIQARYDTFQLPAWRTKLFQNESTISLLGWGGGGGFDIDDAIQIFYDGGPADYARDAELTKLIKDGGGILDRAAREKHYREVLARINERTYTVPLFANGAVYVTAANLDFTPPRLDSPDLTWAKWK
jgi:peptide/nickel transport system substrate-binding protein